MEAHRHSPELQKEPYKGHDHGPEVVPQQYGFQSPIQSPVFVQSPAQSPMHPFVYYQPEYPQEKGFAEAPQPEPLIWGMRKTTFILSVVLAFVILAAALGGGLGGTMAVNNANAQCQQ